jgi:hypothetical protein
MFYYHYVSEKLIQVYTKNHLNLHVQHILFHQLKECYQNLYLIEWRGDSNAKLLDAIIAFSNKRPRCMGQLSRMSGKKAKEIVWAIKIYLNHINYILSDSGGNKFVITICFSAERLIKGKLKSVEQ